MGAGACMDLCALDPCAAAACPANPSASCRRRACGACEAVFVADGMEVACAAGGDAVRQARCLLERLPSRLLEELISAADHACMLARQSLQGGLTSVWHWFGDRAPGCEVTSDKLGITCCWRRRWDVLPLQGPSAPPGGEPMLVTGQAIAPALPYPLISVTCWSQIVLRATGATHAFRHARAAGCLKLVISMQPLPAVGSGGCAD